MRSTRLTRSLPRVALAAAAVALAATGCAHTPDRPPATALNLHLTWRPTDNPRDLSGAGIMALAQQRVSITVAGDTRPEPKNQFGVNNEDPTPRPVTTPDDIDGFIATHLAGLLQANGVEVVPSGATRILSITPMTFFVTETGTYQVNVSFGVTLKDGGGKVLWQGAAVGSGHRWGHSFDPVNYIELAASGVFDALKNLLSNPAFQQAAAPSAPSAPPAAPSAPPAAPSHG